MNPRTTVPAFAVTIALAFGCHTGSVQTGAAPAALNTLTAEEQAQGWRLLFDGRSTAGWRAYRADSMSSGWQVVDGALTTGSLVAMMAYHARLLAPIQNLMGLYTNLVSGGVSMRRSSFRAGTSQNCTIPEG